MNIITIENIAKIYQVGSEEVHALRDVSLKIDKNEYVALMGPSGSGKSTLMNILGCLDTPTKGLYNFTGQNVSEMDDNDLAKIPLQKCNLELNKPYEVTAVATDRIVSGTFLAR